MPHTTLIIGLGRIGMGYDFDKDPKQFVLSHARAFQQHEAFSVVCGVDASGDNRTRFAERFGAPAYATVDDALSALKPDVIVVATPTATHDAILKQVLSASSPRAILCEKPLTGRIDNARAFIDACKARGIRVYVNYMRVSEPATAELQRRLNAGLIESPIRGLVWYSKGVSNSATHFVNLSQHLLGAVQAVQLIAADEAGDQTDPEPDFRVTFKRGIVDFMSARTKPYFHNTMEWIAPNGRMRYEAGGAVVRWEGLQSSALYAGYTTLAPAENVPGDFERSQWHVVDQLAADLSGLPSRICSGDDALQTLDVISRL